MDEWHYERAERIAEAARAEAEADARAAAAPQHHPDFDGLHCIEPDCGAEIPAGRLALGKIRCVDCQALRETRRAA